MSYHPPADNTTLPVQVSVLCDQISSPALAGTEAVGASVLLKAMAEAFGHSVERVKDEVFPRENLLIATPA